MNDDPSASRRKVVTRVIGAPLLLAALAGIVYADVRWGKPLGVIVLLGLFAIVSYRELCAMGRERGLRPAEEYGSLALALGFGGQFLSFYRAEPGPLDPMVGAGFLVVLLLLVVARCGLFTPADAGFSVLAFGYTALLSFVVMPLKTWCWTWLDGSAGQGVWFLLFLVAVNKGSDMAAYVFGKLFGRHKLAPAVSPNKTWEGAIAGFVAGTGLGAIVLERTSLRSAFADAGLGGLIMYSAAVNVAAQLGDLVKSAIKRWAGVKDSGRLLPEFGGALDMCDSFMLSAPAAWAGLQLLQLL